MSMDAGWSLRRLRDDGYYNRYQFNPFAVLLLDDFRGRAVRPGAFFEQSWATAGGRVRLSGGVRYDRHETNGVQAVSPHAAAAVLAGGSTHLLLGWGQYVQFPDLQWLLLKIGGHHLLPERANHFVAAVEQRLGERTRIRAEFYDRADRDLLFRPLYEPRLIGGAVFNPPLDPPVMNALGGYARGFEVYVQRRTANRLTGWASYSYGRTRLRDGVTGAEFPADQDQRHTVNAYGSYRIRPTVNLSLKGIHGSGFPVPGFYRREEGQYSLAEQRNRVRIDAYQRVDARVNKAFTFDRWRMTLYGEVVNLFNRDNYRYDSFGGYSAQTGRARPRFDKMFPILPSAGIVMEFEGRR
jgi:outer membrane cobalamin receptor